jgi:RNA polymerase sigma-70 factor (ECF subfamily)
MKQGTDRRDALPWLADEQIVARVVAGEGHLFEHLMRRHNQRVYRLTRAIATSSAEAEDAMQEAYVQAFTRLAQFERRSSFVTWLTRIAIHAALARVRRGRKETLVDDLDVFDAAPERYPTSSQTMARSPEGGADDRELRAILEQAIDGLPTQYRMVFVLRAVQDMSVAETAASLDMQEETVRTRFFRARAMLKSVLTERIYGTAQGVYELHLSRCDRVVAAVLARLDIDAHATN